MRNNHVVRSIYYLLKFSLDLTLDGSKKQMRALNHEQVFGHLRNATFTSEEAAEFLEISMPTFRRYVQSGKIKPKELIGRSQLFGTIDLRKLKQKLG